MLFLLALLTQAHWIESIHYCTLPPTCDSQVFCQGSLLHTVQMAQIYKDSKTFVDLKIKKSVKETLNNYNILMKKNNKSPTKEQIRQFVNESFELANSFHGWKPPDYKVEPPFIENIRDITLKSHAQIMLTFLVEAAWKMNPDVAVNPNLYTIIFLPNGFILPEFTTNEMYYWDTYWTIRALLISEMTETAKGMIENLMFMVKKFGHVLSAPRVYYIRRSQPPLLTRMVMQYIKYTKDYDWLKKNIGVLDEELKFWIKNRAIRVKRKGMTYRMFHYKAESAGPRPEYYREDMNMAQKTDSIEDMYIELKSAAESGWQFSSRWIFDADGGTNGNLSQLMTRRVIPVDLNAILYDAFSSLAELYETIKDHNKSLVWQTQARVHEFAINNVLWSEKHGVWLDYDSKLLKHRPSFYPSNITPLITNCCAIHKTDNGIKRIIAFLKRNNILKYTGGTPTSLVQSDEKWDFPNAWPPLQSFIIYGLKNTKHKDAEDLAFILAQNWVQASLINVYRNQENSQTLDARTPGKAGKFTGGEIRFGWRNGVLFELLETYGKTLKSINMFP